MASYSIVSYNSTSVTLLVTGLTVGDNMEIVVRLDADEDDRTVHDLPIATSTTMTLVYDWLTPDTTYAVNVRSVASGSALHGAAWIGKQTFTTDSEDERPDDWEWHTAKVAGNTLIVSAVEWNAFCTRINEFREYTGLSPLSFTTVQSGITPISATVCNQAWVGINTISGHGSMPKQPTTGTEITASFFNTLRNALNAIP